MTGELANWIDRHAITLFATTVVIAILSMVIFRLRHAHSIDDTPIAMLRKRSAAALAASTCGVFALLAIAIGDGGALVALDERITAHVRQALGEGTLRVLAQITRLGDTELLAVAAVAITMVLLAMRHHLLAIGWLLALIGNGLLIRITKQAFLRGRPLHEHGIVLEQGYSFPSGHAAGSLVFYGMLAYLLAVLLPPRRRTLLVGATAAIVGVIGTSRVLLQVHHASDVFAGFAMAAAWLAIAIASIEWLRTCQRAR